MDDTVPNLAGAEAKARAAEALAKPSAPSPRKSLLHRDGNSAPDQQLEFNRAAIEAIIELVRSTQAVIEAQESRLAKLEQQVGGFFAFAERLHEVHGRLDQITADADESREAIGELQKGVDSARAEHSRALAESFQELRDQQQRAIQSVLDEQRERIQHLLDEQRVSLRQLALQQSEAAVLADRARRATESRVTELASRLEHLNGEHDAPSR